MKQKKDVFIDNKKGVVHFFKKKQQTKQQKTYKNSKKPPSLSFRLRDPWVSILAALRDNSI